MTDAEYRALAVEFVREIQDLLVHAGSVDALKMADGWTKKEPEQHKAIDAAHTNAMKASAQCAKDGRDGRFHASEAAILLLAPHAKESIKELIKHVSLAKAAKIICERHGALSTATETEFEYIRAVVKELLDDRLAKREGK